MSDDPPIRLEPDDDDHTLRFPTYRSTQYLAFNDEDVPCASVTVDAADPAAQHGRRPDGVHIEMEGLYVHIKGLPGTWVVGDTRSGTFVPLLNPALAGIDPLARKYFASVLEARAYGFVEEGEPVERGAKKERRRKRGP